ncbi:MAG TPA: hypothetical protein VIJ63_06500 [Roseiarcus sp.]
MKVLIASAAEEVDREVVKQVGCRRSVQAANTLVADPQNRSTKIDWIAYGLSNPDPANAAVGKSRRGDSSRCGTDFLRPEQPRASHSQAGILRMWPVLRIALSGDKTDVSRGLRPPTVYFSEA